MSAYMVFHYICGECLHKYPHDEQAFLCGCPYWANGHMPIFQDATCSICEAWFEMAECSRGHVQLEI